MTGRPLLTLALLLLTHYAWADASLRGRLQVQQQWRRTDGQSLQTAEGVSAPALGSAALRLIGAASQGPWQAGLQNQLFVRHGSAVTLERNLTQAGISQPSRNLARSNLWDLEQHWADGTRIRSGQRLERLWLGYNGRHGVLRLGRQALTWGSGQLFHPMDLVDPFPPSATDTEYKPGADMAYGQWLFDDGSDLQLAYLPRRDPADRRWQGDRNVAALYWHHAGYPWQENLLLAHDHGDTVLGLNVTGSLGGATWSAAAIPTLEADGHGVLSLDANLSDAFTLWGRDASGFIEYYRNGFGESGRDYSLASLPPALQARLARGALFNTGIDYLAAGSSLSVTSLWQLQPAWILNLRDRSSLLMLKATDSLAENTDLVFGVQQPLGPLGTEYGGLAMADGSGTYLETPAQFYIRLNQYF